MIGENYIDPEIIFLKKETILFFISDFNSITFLAILNSKDSHFKGWELFSGKPIQQYS